MKATTKFVATGMSIGALTLGMPAAAQYSPYGQPYGSYSPGYGDSYGGYSQIAVNRCAEAVQARLDGYRGSYDYGGGRVLGVSRLEPRPYGGGLTVRGVATSGRYTADPYGQGAPVDLSWRCTTDYRGFVTGLSISPAERSYGGRYDYPSAPYNEYDYSQYGYRRY